MGFESTPVNIPNGSSKSVLKLSNLESARNNHSINTAVLHFELPRSQNRDIQSMLLALSNGISSRL
ncbi:MAG: hypothetical protein CMN79_02635 [Spirochaetales bacterium]|nr:hypothetical protein [Spirochaetales bacterium]